MRASRSLAWCRRYLAPPTGAEVRRLVAMITLAVGLPRLPLMAELFSFAPQRFGPPELYGVLLTALGLALLATSYHGRLTWYGRLTAVLAFTAWVTLAAATLSATSLLINLAIAASCLMEVGTLRHG